MIYEQRDKLVVITPPAAINAVDSTAFTTTEIDTEGFDYVTIYAMLGATDGPISVLQVTESDTAGSGHVPITGLVYGTSVNTAGAVSALPLAGDGNNIFAFEINMVGRKRYLDLNATTGNVTVGTFLAAWAVLSRAKAVADTAAERGCNQILRK